MFDHQRAIERAAKAVLILILLRHPRASVRIPSTILFQPVRHQRGHAATQPAREPIPPSPEGVPLHQPGGTGAGGGGGDQTSFECE